MNIADKLKAATQRLADSDSPRLDAEVLLALVLGKPRSHLMAWPERELSAAEQAAFDGLVEKRRQGVPVAHLTGEREFWSLPLEVEPHTLIPRPDTELLVELALQRIPAGRRCRIADLGTGSGAVALAIASERPHSEVLATDRSPASLELARRNARRLGLRNLAFVCGDWCDALRDASLDLLVSNPPYIAEADPHLARGDLRHEPRQALAAGADGLDALRVLAEQASRVLRPGAWVLLEHGWEQGE
ncbi:MAG TPA: peptide chain release factor N(5)-glutamine methyltransferase, partial [Gammaproteobacteria bacterium]|nr:peptide chain release factor N(5)-glutamine methyltransferase [Gammaproteobacteria bacterium]